MTRPSERPSYLPRDRAFPKPAKTALRIMKKPQTIEGKNGRRWYGPEPLAAAGNVTIVMHKATAPANQMNVGSSFGVNNAYISKNGARHIASNTIFCSKSHRFQGTCLSI